MKETDPEILDLNYRDFLPVFDHLSAGVIVVNRTGRIIYYNDAMARIDDVDRQEALHRLVTEIYELTPETSMLMQCLRTRRPIIDRPFYYRTRMGRVANTIHSVYPLFKNKSFKGAVCFVRDYNVLEETLTQVSIPRAKENLGNNTRFTFSSIIGKDPEFLRAVNTGMMAANTPSPVMLYGETGTGKELFAQSIHNFSDRKTSRYTAVNCAAIPENLLEGILFGTSKGAFTGAHSKPGLFEKASGGTLFLDELNSMPVGLQAKILRVLQEHRVRRLGSFKEIEVDLKIISSVNRQPHTAIAEGSLRPDLFYRLGVVFIPIPPLRERKTELERLIQHFIRKHGRALGKEVTGIAPEVLDIFKDYHWPGNVRELEHVIEGALNLVGEADTIELDHLRSHLPTWYRMKNQPSTPDSYFPEPFAAPAPGPPAPTHPESAQNGDGHPPKASGRRGKNLIKTQEDREKRLILKALQTHQGNVTRAAHSMGISRQLLHYKMKKHQISRAEFV